MNAETFYSWSFRGSVDSTGQRRLLAHQLLERLPDVISKVFGVVENPAEGTASEAQQVRSRMYTALVNESE